MEQYAVDQLKAIARVSRTTPQLSRAERLGRWAELLEDDPARSLVTLRETEYRVTNHAVGYPVRRVN